MVTREIEASDWDLSGSPVRVWRAVAKDPIGRNAFGQSVDRVAALSRMVESAKWWTPMIPEEVAS